MISRLNRFHGHTAMRFVYGRGQTVRGSGLSLRYVRNPRRQTYRAAIVVSRKVHKSAVVRNRIRRRIYEIIRQCRLQTADDLIITVFDARYATVATAVLQVELAALLTKAKQASVAPDSPESHV